MRVAFESESVGRISYVMLEANDVYVHMHDVNREQRLREDGGHVNSAVSNFSHSWM